MSEGGAMGEGTAAGGDPGMPLRDALAVLAELRGLDDVVITSMASAREWPRLSRHPLDFHYVPSAMGGAPAFGLGLALAQPRRRVIVLCGDGSLLMNLGSLVTIAASGADNLSLVLLDNGVYEITGGQRTAGAAAGANYAGLAQAAGFPNVGYFHSLRDWRRRAAGWLAERGPRFAWLVVAPEREDYALTPPAPMAQQLGRLRQALAPPDPAAD